MKTVTVVDHELRNKLDLSCIEYCVCEYYATDEPYLIKEKLAAIFGMTKKNYMAVTKRLIKKGYLTKGARRGHLVCTDQWSKNFFNNKPIKEPKSTTFATWVPSETITGTAQK